MERTSCPGVYRRGTRWVAVYRIDGRQRKEAAATFADARELKRARGTRPQAATGFAAARLRARLGRSPRWRRPRHRARVHAQRVPPVADHLRVRILRARQAPGRSQSRRRARPDQLGHPSAWASPPSKRSVDREHPHAAARLPPVRRARRAGRRARYPRTRVAAPAWRWALVPVPRESLPDPRGATPSAGRDPRPVATAVRPACLNRPAKSPRRSDCAGATSISIARSRACTRARQSCAGICRRAKVPARHPQLADQLRPRSTPHRA